ncbi:lytic transglycosylase domain-containing protein [Pedomonas sp.]|uniref:lytic transglycosylase domain-containing protein n=1 Tax=Pedomonas sp. TaxID=2976421 RepID=UPI002F3F7238
MMRHTVTLFLLLFRVAPSLADAPPPAGILPPSTAAPPAGHHLETEGGPGGFRLVVHRQDRVDWEGAERFSGDGTAGDGAVSGVSCHRAEYRWHPSVPAHVNERRRVYWPIVVESACKHGVPVALFDAVVLAESLYQATAVSRAGARGLAQLMPGTARELGVADSFDPYANLNGGALYLRRMMDSFGSPLLAVAAYNAGPGRVRRAGGLPTNDETLGYVKKVMDYWRHALQALPQEPFGQSQLSEQPKAITIARMTGVASQ